MSCSEVDSTVENRDACRVDTTAGGAIARHVVEREMLARDDAASSSRERRDSMVYCYWFCCYDIMYLVFFDFLMIENMVRWRRAAGPS